MTAPQPSGRAIFDLGDESNLGGRLAAIALRADHARWKWWPLAVFVLGASIDESVSLRERLGQYIEDTVHTSGRFAYGWVIPGIVFVVVVGLWCGPMLLRTKGGWLVVVGAAVFLVGAVGLEMVASRPVAEPVTAPNR